MILQKLYVPILFCYCNSFIIPNEIPTILSVVYSNIPPIKFGIDSRFGYGFRIGQHVDYQSLLEIGPQTNTNPLSTNGTSTAKRQSSKTDRLLSLNSEEGKNLKRSEVVQQKKKSLQDEKLESVPLENKSEYMPLKGTVVQNKETL